MEASLLLRAIDPTPRSPAYPDRHRWAATWKLDGCREHTRAHVQSLKAYRRLIALGLVEDVDDGDDAWSYPSPRVVRTDDGDAVVQAQHAKLTALAKSADALLASLKPLPYGPQQKGRSRETMRKVGRVVDLAKHDPLMFGDLPGKMDRADKVDKFYKLAMRRMFMMISDGKFAAQPL